MHSLTSVDKFRENIMIKAKIVGAGGYGGSGITELLAKHPEAEAAVLVDVENAGASIADLYPHLTGFVDLVIVDPSDAKALEPADVVFMATPDGVGMKLASGELDKGAFDGKDYVAVKVTNLEDCAIDVDSRAQNDYYDVDDIASDPEDGTLYIVANTGNGVESVLATLVVNNGVPTGDAVCVLRHYSRHERHPRTQL